MWKRAACGDVNGIRARTCGKPGNGDRIVDPVSGLHPGEYGGPPVLGVQLDLDVPVVTDLLANTFDDLDKDASPRFRQIPRIRPCGR